MDVHRSFAQIAIVEDGLCRDEGRIGVRPEELREWAAGLRPDDEVALEARPTRTRSRRCCGRSFVEWWSPTQARRGQSRSRR